MHTVCRVDAVLLLTLFLIFDTYRQFHSFGSFNKTLLEADNLLSVKPHVQSHTSWDRVTSYKMAAAEVFSLTLLRFHPKSLNSGHFLSNFGVWRVKRCVTTSRIQRFLLLDSSKTLARSIWNNWYASLLNTMRVKISHRSDRGGILQHWLIAVTRKSPLSKYFSQHNNKIE